MLTKEDAKALHAADYVCLFYRPDGSEGPVWGIRAGQRFEDAVWGAKDRTRTIAAEPRHSIIVDYQHGVAREAVAVRNMYRTIDDMAASTPFDALRTGDEIGLRFIANNGSDNTRGVGWVRDECYLRIVRKERIVAEYMIDVYVGPNNSARIVR